MQLSRRQFIGAAGGLLALAGLPRWAGASSDLAVRSFHALGTQVRLLVRERDVRLARTGIRAAMRAIFAVHQEMTRHDPSPLTSLNDRGHHGPVAISDRLYGVLAASLSIATASQGCFDPTVGGLVISHRLAGVGRQYLELESGTARLTNADTRLDLGGIAKGHAVDRAAQALRDVGLTDFVVNAGGDLYAAGEHTIAIQGTSRQLTVRDQAVATSGNELAPAPHLWDPRQGRVATSLRSATVVAATCLTADAWATAAYVAGKSDAERLVAGRGIQLVLL